MITNNLNTLVLNKLSDKQYEREYNAGNIDPNQMYLTPDIEEPKTVYVQDSEPGDAMVGSLWVDTNESPVEIEKFETWTFTLEDGSTVTKNVKVGI